MQKLSPYIDSIKGNRIAIIVTEVRNPWYYIYFYDLVVKMEKKGKKISILSIKNNEDVTNYVNVLEKNREKNRFLVQKYREIFLNQIKKTTKAEILESNFTKNDANCNVITPKSLSELEKSEKFSIPFKRSVRSILITHITKSGAAEIGFRNFKKQITTMFKTYLNTLDSLIESNIAATHDVLVSLNGRLADQTAVQAYAEAKGINLYRIEHGSDVGERYFLAPCQPQDVVDFQEWYKENITTKRSKIEAEVVAAKAKKWLMERRRDVPNFGQGRKLQKWRPTEDILQNQNIGIFVSSLGEMDFQDGNFHHQLKLWSKVFNKIVQFSNTSLIIRFHPNLLNYRWLDLIELFDNLRNTCNVQQKASIHYIFPWEAISSYDILPYLNGVITWNSTLGLEAAYDGIPIGVLTETFYSRILGLSPLNPEDLEESLEALFRVDPRRVLFAIEQLVDNGETLTKTLELGSLRDELFSLKQGDLNQNYLSKALSCVNNLIFDVKYIFKQLRYPKGALSLLIKLMERERAEKILRATFFFFYYLHEIKSPRKFNSDITNQKSGFYSLYHKSN